MCPKDKKNLRLFIFEELIQVVWHPKNIEKFRYLDTDLDL
jgi:hypothetical protein